MRSLHKAWGSRGTALVIGLVVVVAFAASVVFAFRAQYGIPGAQVTLVKAAFGDVGSLRVGDDVRIASARVGSVDDVRYEDGRAVAILKLDGDRPVYQNSSATTASVGARSALGQKFVDLDPGSPEAGALGPDDVIPARDTRGAQEVSDLFTVFDPPTRAALGSTLREAGGGLAGHSQDLQDALAAAPQMLPNLGTVSRSLTADGGDDLVGLLQSASTLSERFAGREQEIASLLTNMSATFDAIAVDGAAPFEQTLQASPETLRDARSALDELNGPLTDTRDAVLALRPGAEALGAATPDVRGVLREGVGPLQRVPGVADAAEPAVAELTGLMADARPLTPRLADTVAETAGLLADLAPYSPEIAHWFTNVSSALHDGDGAGNWLRIYPIFESDTVSGTLPVEDPLVARNANPEPGESAQDIKPLPGIGGRR
ncbi:MlaD family protein [Pseudonocardia sp. H11422]|uniref:MlaD family protein n=1 Tax=Pseudonocardia sp. H11422 TaxID=2835866 RepID=UPI001BDC0FB4|nr:MlaD family protein [Pseudonocardia sp. H11422]